jgi:GxxExxY protein
MVNHRDTEDTEDTEHPDFAVSALVLGAAIEVHRSLGPGLLESTYQRCLEHELTVRDIDFEAQKSIDFIYKGLRLSKSYRVDLLVQNRLVVEVKAVDQVQPIHSAQLLTYLRLSNLRIGLLLNFNVPTLAKGVRRLVNGR